MLNKPITKLVAKGVVEILTQSVKGCIHTTVIRDTLYVDIAPNNSISFRYTCDNIFDKVVNGMSSADIAQDCLKSYKRYINCQIFK